MKTNPLNQQTVTMDEAQKSNPILPSIAPKNGKRKSVLAMAAFLLVIMSGCLVKSLHPFYTDKDIVYRNDILGTYTDQEKGTWTIEQKVIKGGPWRPLVTEATSYYLLKMVDKKKRTVTLRGVLFKLDNNLYVDFYLEKADDKDDETELFSMHVLGVHTVARVTITKNELHLKWYNEEWLSDLFEENKIRLAHENLDDKNIVLTASTQELQKFMKKFANDPKAFEKKDMGGKFEYVLTR